MYLLAALLTLITVSLPVWFGFKTISFDLSVYQTVDYYMNGGSYVVHIVLIFKKHLSLDAGSNNFRDC